MKKLTLATILAILLMPLQAIATDAPTVDDPTSPIDADKYTLTGTSEPGAQITVTGGPYMLSPVYADDNGDWERTVSLGQEVTNTFSIQAVGEDGQPSEIVTVTIVESEAEAQAAEEETGEDRTAPDTPTVDDMDSPVDADAVTLTGTAEVGSTIVVSGADTGEDFVTSSGTFSVKVELNQNASNKFYIYAMDSEGNISSSTSITIEEVSPEEETTEEENTETEEEEEVVEITFSDIDGHWAYDDIMELAELGIVEGYPDGSFGPSDYINRAAITKIALEAFGYEVYEADSQFPDVEDGEWFTNYINSAYAYEIIGGYPDGTFAPANEVNRAEALKILIEASGVEDLNGASVFLGDEEDWVNSFSDVTEDDWYYTYLMEASETEVVSGYADGTFGGGNSITRAEVCRITLNLINLKAEIIATPTI